MNNKILYLFFFFIVNSFSLSAQEKRTTKYFIELDSIGIPTDTVSYSKIKNCIQYYVYGQKPSGEIFECKIVSGRISVTGIPAYCYIHVDGKSYSKPEQPSRKCSLLKQSKNRHVTLFIKYLDEKGNKRSIGTGFNVTN